MGVVVQRGAQLREVPVTAEREVHGASFRLVVDSLALDGLPLDTKGIPRVACLAVQWCGCPPASSNRFHDAWISASASVRPTQVAPSTLLPGSRSL